MEKRFVVPGEEIGTSEEFLPGEGTFEEEGKVFSATVGSLEYDPKEMVAKVKVRSAPVTLKVGDAVIGEIIDVKSGMAIVNVVSRVGSERQISGETLGAIHVSKVSNTYVQEFGRVFRIGDIVRAEVIQTKPSLQLSTAGRIYGVIKARCMRCRLPLKRDGNDLVCDNCERVESRKIAIDYGLGRV